MRRGSAYAQRMRMCADDTPSACIMRGGVFCADYAHSAHVRMCACAVLRSVRICAACASARVRWCAVCAEAGTLRGQAQSASFSFVFTSGRAIPATKHGCPDTRAGKRCAMKVAKHTPATRFRRPQHELSRTRAAKVPPMRNAVTLDVLEHVHTSKFHIPAVRVAVRNPLKT